MIKKKILCPDKTRKIQGSFAAIEHRFVRDGFFGSLTHSELLLYFFLVMVSDRYGLSYYAYDKICSCLQMPVEDYLEARNGLIEKELIAFDGALFRCSAFRTPRQNGPLFYSGHRRIWKGTIRPPSLRFSKTPSEKRHAKPAHYLRDTSVGQPWSVCFSDCKDTSTQPPLGNEVPQ